MGGQDPETVRTHELTIAPILERHLQPPAIPFERGFVLREPGSDPSGLIPEQRGGVGCPEPARHGADRSRASYRKHWSPIAPSTGFGELGVGGRELSLVAGLHGIT